MSTSRAQARSDAQQEAIAKRQSGGSARKRESPAPAAPAVDEETAAALTLFNAYLTADREQQAHERALKKAEKAKDEAAAAVRKLNDKKASSSETAAAEAAYREAAEALRRLRDGDTAAPEDSDEEAEDHPETPTDGADAAGQDAAGAPDAAAGQDAASAPDAAAEDASNSS